jgi:hypothetical protein
MTFSNTRWGDSGDPSELDEEGTGQSENLTPSSAGSLESVPEAQGRGKRKFNGKQDHDKRQKSCQDSQLEWIIKDAVERAVRPLLEELTQIKKILQEKEQEGRKQGVQGQRGKPGAQDQVPRPDHPTARTTREAEGNADTALSYSQAVKKGLPATGSQGGWTTVQNKKKAKKAKFEQRRVLFQLDKKLDIDAKDLLLKVNQALRQEKAEGISFHQLNVTRTGQVSGLLNEYSNREALEPYLAKVVQVFESGGVKVQQAGAPQTWSKLKVHTVSLQRYYKEGGQDLIKDEIEATLGLQLPVGVRWLKNVNKIQQAREEGAQYSSVVVTVPSKDIANRLKSQGIYFGGRRHMAEAYHDSAREVCSRCCRTSHQGECENPPVCFICGEDHLRKDHECRECKSRNPCQHSPLKCANCGGKHEAVNPSCPSVRKAQRQEKERQEEPPRDADTGISSSPPLEPIVLQSSSPEAWSTLPSSPLERRSQQVIDPRSDTPPLQINLLQRKGSSQDDKMEGILSKIEVRQDEDEDEEL